MTSTVRSPPSKVFTFSAQGMAARPENLRQQIVEG